MVRYDTSLATTVALTGEGGDVKRKALPKTWFLTEFLKINIHFTFLNFI